MAQQDGAAGKRPAASVLHSHFMVGSVSEENSEDENQGKADLQLEEKENRSLSPSSCSSDNAYETGFDVDGTAHNLRLAVKPFSFWLMWQFEYQRCLFLGFWGLLCDSSVCKFSCQSFLFVSSFDCKCVKNWLQKVHRAFLFLKLDFLDGVSLSTVPI